eukprot:353973-Chlamydomonas_euryale.AAC.4
MHPVTSFSCGPLERMHTCSSVTPLRPTPETAGDPACATGRFATPQRAQHAVHPPRPRQAPAGRWSGEGVGRSESQGGVE